MAANAFLAASTFVTSSTRAAAVSPRARIADAAASISARVRAASVTCAPAAASADAAASPMTRPPPVTSARLPSRRNEGVLARLMDVWPLMLAHASVAGDWPTFIAHSRMVFQSQSHLVMQLGTIITFRDDGDRPHAEVALRNGDRIRVV